MPKSDEIDLKDCWQVMKRRKWIILFTLLVVISLALSVNALTQPVYQATSQILIEKGPTRSPLTGAVIDIGSSLSDDEAFHTAVELITSRMLLGRVVNVLGERLDIWPHHDPESLIEHLKWQVGSVLEKFKEILPVMAQSDLVPEITEEERQRIELNSQIDLLSSMISVEPVRDTRLVNIHVEHTDPIVAQEIADTVAQTFITYQAQQREEANKSLTAFLETQLLQVKGRIEGSERAFYAFKDQEALFSLEGKLGELGKMIGDLNTSYVKTKSERLAVEARLNKLKIIRKENVEDWRKLPIQSETLDVLRRDLLLSQTELAKAREVYKSQHPKRKTLESAVLSVQNNIQKELDNAMSRLEAEHTILMSHEEQLKSAIAQTEREMHGINKKALQYSILERELNTNKDLYGLLLTKLKETDITGEIKIPIVQLVAPAAMPTYPFRPRKAMNLALSLVVGLIVGIGLAFFREYLRRTIRTSQDVTDQLQLPVLGMIPKGP